MTITDTRLDQSAFDPRRHDVEPGTDSPTDQVVRETHYHTVGGEQNPGTSRPMPDTQRERAGAGQTPPPTVVVATPIHQPSAGAKTPPPANDETHPRSEPPVVDPLLFVHATIHADLEKSRIAMDNRVRILTTDTPDDDGVMRGFGLTDAHPDVARVAGIAQAMAQLENDAKLGMGRAFRRSSIYPWVKAQRGLGEKQVARLLAATGDPYWHTETVNEDGTVRHPEGPRTVSQLWAYSGLHVLPASHATGDAHGRNAGGAQTGNPGQNSSDTHCAPAGVAARRRKGQRANWSTGAKTRAYLVATSCLKQLDADCKDGHSTECRCSPYRIKYDQRRRRTAATHPDWTDGHSHADGLRIAAKEILKDLWREAKRLHDSDARQCSADTHLSGAGVGPDN